MNQIFLTVLSMSVAASLTAACVLILRRFLKCACKSYSYFLWFLVLFRLLCPLTFADKISIVPNVMTGAIAVEGNVGALTVTFAKMLSFFSYAWISGTILFLCVNLVQYMMLKKALTCAVIIDQNILISEHIHTSFVFGIWKPRIYLPSDLEGEEKKYILEHEKVHIERRDYFVKWLFLIALAIHWFNPFIWYCVKQMDDDLEMSCDEKVVEKFEYHTRKKYSEVLFYQAIKQKNLMNLIGFGAGNVSKRIQHILNLKKMSVKKKIGIMVSVFCASALLLQIPQVIFSYSSEMKYSEIYPEFYRAVDEDVITIAENELPTFYTDKNLSKACISAIETYYMDSQKPGFMDMSINDRFIVTSFRD